MTTVRTNWYGAAAKRAARAGAAAGLRTAIELMFAAAQRDVPRATGALAASGRTTVDESRLRGEIHYGEGLGEYPAIVHEKPEIRHPDGRAKWLELAVRQLRGPAGLIIAAAIRRRLR